MKWYEVETLRTYEFVATTNTRILFEQKKTYDGNGNVVWTPTCTITEN